MPQQFQVPQFIDIEPKLLGPLTVRQTVILGFAAIILFAIYFFVELFLFIILAVAAGAFAISLAFIEINGRPLLGFLSSFFAYFTRPKLYVWKTQPQKAEAPEVKKKKRRKKREEGEEGGATPTLTPEQIKQLAKRLDAPE